MTDDLVPHLRRHAKQFGVSHVPNICDAAADRIEALEAALKNIAEGDVSRTVKIPFRDDGQPSKNDRCEHGQWFYEECGCCIEDYAREVLK